MAEGIGNNTVVQVGLIVRDIEEKLDAYCRIFGLETRPQVTITDPVEQTGMVYRGESSPARAKLAFINMGQVQIELIEPDGNPSTWQEFLDQHGEGVHHLAFFVKGTDQVVAYLDSHGIPLVQQGHYTGGMYTYLDSAPQLGVMLELLENFE
ncbi:MAG: VOC family protein [Chloroflexi bacterium]|nr:VOC family protein [Chloroflexota bacterium]